MLTCQKHLFSIPDEVSYLNCSYMSPIPEPVEFAGYQAIAKKTMPYEILVPDFFEPVNHLKSLFSKLINCDDPERIAIVPSVSYGISSVVKNVKIGTGQNIVAIDEIFPSNFYPWRRLTMENGGEIKVVKRPDEIEGRGRIWNERLLEAIDNQTVAVAVPNVHWADGTLFDLRAIRLRANEVGAMLIVDGTQSVGALPFDLAEIQPDALVCGGYKWLLGPYSMGMAYFGERFDNGVPIEESWMNRKDSERFENLTSYQDTYKPKAHRYNMGENSQFIGVPMLTAALELILGWGVKNIQEYCKNLSAPYIQHLVELGFHLEQQAYRCNHLIGVRLPAEINLEAVKNATVQRNVYVSYRAGAMRISPHLYNDSKDFERLVEAVEDVIKG
ncbi:MAG: aminotransferase class V-fold PLP-dependent enzyme [Saprospiraceae bacterium]|nr:aminotransferase class V-fold PLP-dependent enzyme [Saprospiraceae bacterium]MCF8249949.1 aminotransferase class V-fold PLP-dependent enzyme [Saprospiraceae bacterium]MCF8279362.1 aminotransferase class V-fold PLP-dependent enzyme [Bacteroidales bacterium]MCF8310053.1 aminotransferase class V-fold PLP-dependent enzyme [Saprospiraceae bacterium]MCF8438953.1 aminotransferase class V-fold PLP-dependent enzyme [Saprospiraceae bacterium]